MNEVEIIKAARQRISDPARWGKGSIIPAPGAHCAAHALSMGFLDVTGRAAQTEDEFRAVTDLVRQHTPGRVGISIYNDDPDTTHQDILNLLDKTLADLGGL